MEKVAVYDIQEFTVEYDTTGPVSIRVGIYHENQTGLSREEILEEAEGYLKDANIPTDFLSAEINVVRVEGLRRVPVEEVGK